MVAVSARRAEFDASIGIFGLKTPLHEHVIGEHTSMDGFPPNLNNNTTRFHREPGK